MLKKLVALTLTLVLSGMIVFSASAEELDKLDKDIYTTTTASTTLALNTNTAEVNDISSQVLELVNAERAKKGVAPLTTTDDLKEAANIRSAELETSYEHVRPDNRRFYSVLEDKDINYLHAAENIAWGKGKNNTAESVVTSWVNSSSHYSTMIDSKYTAVGISCHILPDGTYYWAQVFIGGSI